MKAVSAFVLVLLFLTLLPVGTLEARAVVVLEAAVIDVYTQKEPYSGRGANNASDAFAPDEEVILYAYVSFNHNPLQNKFVTFNIHGPANPVENITISRTATTNESGIANVSFRIPWPPENLETIVFGAWIVYAHFEIAEEIVSDTLTFRVGWIVEIVSLMTVDQELQPQNRFMRDSYMGAELTIKNIAMTYKNATLIITVLDFLDYVVSTVIDDNLEVKPGETQVYYSIYIPEWSACGNATLYAVARSPTNSAYCPMVSATFLITLFGDLNGDGVVDIRDISRAARAFGSYPGHPRWDSFADVNQDRIVDIIDISLIARNFGETCE